MNVLSIFYLLNGAVAAADKVVNGSLFALPVDRGVNNNYFNNSLAAIYRMLNETAAAIQWFVLRYPLPRYSFQNVHAAVDVFANVTAKHKLKDCCRYVKYVYLIT